MTGNMIACEMAFGIRAAYVRHLVRSVQRKPVAKIEGIVESLAVPPPCCGADITVQFVNCAAHAQ